MLESASESNQGFWETPELESESESLATRIGIQTMRFGKPGIVIRIGISPNGKGAGIGPIIVCNSRVRLL